MGKNETNVIKISPSSSEKERKTTSSSSERVGKKNRKVEKKKMGKNETKVIKISPSSSEKEQKTCSSSSSEGDGSPIRPTLCVQRNADLKRIEETEDCFILDFNPFECVDLSKLSVNNDLADASEKERKTSSSSSEEDGSPIRPIFCLKRNADMKRIEEMEDCFILEFDPSESIEFSISKLSINNDPADGDPVFSNDLSVVAEKGQVACRDYPHSRHLCMKFPFKTTPHEKYCNLCYCYVCDSAAPCKFWTEPKPAAHCHASEHVGDWKSQRTIRKLQQAVAN